MLGCHHVRNLPGVEEGGRSPEKTGTGAPDSQSYTAGVSCAP